jgi:hypothetical protein
MDQDTSGKSGSRSWRDRLGIDEGKPSGGDSASTRAEPALQPSAPAQAKPAAPQGPVEGCCTACSHGATSRHSCQGASCTKASTATGAGGPKMMRLQSGCASTAKLPKRRSRKEQELQASRSFPLPRRKSRLHRPRRPSLRQALPPRHSHQQRLRLRLPRRHLHQHPGLCRHPHLGLHRRLRPRVPPVHRCNVQCRSAAPPQQPAYRPQQPGYPGAQQPPAYRPPGPGYAPPPAAGPAPPQGYAPAGQHGYGAPVAPAPRSPAPPAPGYPPAPHGDDDLFQDNGYRPAAPLGRPSPDAPQPKQGQDLRAGFDDPFDDNLAGGYGGRTARDYSQAYREFDDDYEDDEPRRGWGGLIMLILALLFIGALAVGGVLWWQSQTNTAGRNFGFSGATGRRTRSASQGRTGRRSAFPDGRAATGPQAHLRTPAER